MEFTRDYDERRLRDDAVDYYMAGVLVRTKPRCTVTVRRSGTRCSVATTHASTICWNHRKLRKEAAGQAG